VTRTAGTLLGGRVRYVQPAGGYRTGIEPVLLAASIPAVSGDRVLEAGTGAGAGLLCLAACVPGISGVGIELDPTLAALALSNFAANGFDRLSVHAGDLMAWRPDAATFDHAFANPPWHRTTGSPPPEEGRRIAKQAPPGLLASWVSAMARALRPRGTLSLILPSSALSEAVVALNAARIQEVTLHPLWPRAETSSKLMILQGKHLGRGPSRVLPGLVLHQGAGYSAEADAIISVGMPTSLAALTRNRPRLKQ